MNCSKCRKELRPYKTVVLNSDGKSEEVCMECFNGEVEDELGIKTGELMVKQVTLTDKEGKSYLFDITKMIVPTGIALEARELKAGVPEEEEDRYEFHVLGDIDCDIVKLFKKLYKKIEDGISVKYLDKNGIINDTVKGRLVWNKDSEERIHNVVIDGQELTWDELGKLLSPYEGFQFKLDIFDITD